MLRATHTVLKPGAPHCFYVITDTDELTDADRERLAMREGNEHVESPKPYDVLMEDAGFTDIELNDVTPQYIETLERWKQAWEADAEAFTALVGEQDYVRRLRNRALDIGNAGDGLVRRYRVYGAKP